MALTIGTRIGSHEIIALLGRGGMGEVYRARDTKLKREVAIKILPDEFSRDVERVSRFQREAELLASLNHPNIAAIYDLQEANDTRLLVLELVEGETLAELIARGPIPVEEALEIGKYICEALEAAHEKGIIHRDLKPANVKITPQGKVKVLDFGLAKALDPGLSATDVSQLPTITSPAMTRMGVILGTAAYMSPEQARGKNIDKRADIWAFGCVLYEMLAGKRAFHGEDATETLASVFKIEPDWHALSADTPSNIRTLLLRCLQKDIKKRLRDAGDIVIEFEQAPTTPATLAAVPPLVAPMFSRRSTVVGLTALLLGGLITGFAIWRLQPAPTAQVSRLNVMLPPGQQLARLGLTAIDFSRDGRRLVDVATAGGSQQLYVREMNTFEGRPIAGTDGAANPFFSPDGQSVGFFTIDTLKIVSVNGGPPITLARVNDSGRGGSWGNDGNIIFASGPESELSVVSAAGGTVETLTKLDRQKAEGSHRFPHHLPGGNALLFTVGTGGSWDDARIEVLKLGTGERKVLIEGGSDARYVLSGHLVYRRAGTLMAVPLDLERLKVTVSPVVVVEGLLGSKSNSGAAQATITDAGSLAYVSGSPRAFENTLTWVDRKGTEQPLPLPPRAYVHPRLSPDGQRVVLSIDEGNAGDVWIYDLHRETLTRLTFEGVGGLPFWTPNGKKVTFESGNKAGPSNLFWKTADGTGADQQLTTSENSQLSGSWSPDGETLAFTEINPATGWDIWTLSLKNGQKAEPFLRTSSNEANPAFSPDGRWVAYESNESRRGDEIYVRRFPGASGKVQVSTEGGTEVTWSRGGHELFYTNGDKMMGVAIMLQPTFSASKPQVLFERPHAPYRPLRSYDVTSDGRRFLMLKETEQVAATTAINMVVNWFEELKRRVPVR